MNGMRWSEQGGGVTFLVRFVLSCMWYGGQGWGEVKEGWMSHVLQYK